MRRIGARLADALAHVHSNGIIHRDLKPANVLLGTDGRPRLADFGIARALDGTAVTGTGYVVGTAAYLAPEQVRGEWVGPAADVYALGLVLLEALTGRREYPGALVESATARLHRPPNIPDSLPSDLRTTLFAMTALEPAVRPTAAEVVGLLGTGSSRRDRGGYGQGCTDSGAPGTRPCPGPSGWRRRWPPPPRSPRPRCPRPTAAPGRRPAPWCRRRSAVPSRGPRVGRPSPWTASRPRSARVPTRPAATPPPRGPLAHAPRPPGVARAPVGPRTPAAQHRPRPPRPTRPAGTAPRTDPRESARSGVRTT